MPAGEAALLLLAILLLALLPVILDPVDQGELSTSAVTKSDQGHG